MENWVTGAVRSWMGRGYCVVMFDRERLIADAVRKQRRDGIRLIAVSSVFVVIGAVVMLGLGHPIGLLCLLFFGGCLLIGIMQVVGEERVAGRILLVIAASIAAVGCAIAVILESMGVRVIGGWRASPGFVIPVMAISAVFYFVGAVVALVQLVRFVRGDWARPPRRSRRRFEG